MISVAFSVWACSCKAGLEPWCVAGALCSVRPPAAEKRRYRPTRTQGPGFGAWVRV